MQATNTQIAAYDAIAGRRPTQKQVILELFFGPIVTMTRQEIADRTSLRLSSVCGRVNELIDSGTLSVRGSRKCDETGVLNETVGLPLAG